MEADISEESLSAGTCTQAQMTLGEEEEGKKEAGEEAVGCTCGAGDGGRAGLGQNLKDAKGK